MSTCSIPIRLGQSARVELGQGPIIARLGQVVEAAKLGQHIPVRLGQGFSLHVCARERENNDIPAGALMLEEGVPILSEDGKFIVVANWVAP